MRAEGGSIFGNTLAASHQARCQVARPTGRRFFSLLSALFAITLLVACDGGGAVSPTSSTLRPNLSFANGNSQTVVYGATPQSAVAICTASDSSKSYIGVATYSSSDTAVARVDVGGTVTVAKAGTAAITATCPAYSGGSYAYEETTGTHTVTVSKATPTLALNNASGIEAFDLLEGATAKRTATITPPCTVNVTTCLAAAGAISYVSSNTGVATVDPSSGLVTGVGVGTVTITANQAAVTAVHRAATASYTVAVVEGLVVTLNASGGTAGSTSQVVVLPLRLR